ncbi:MAG: hypothetical protein E7107_01965 [Prevotella sp.]|jgi:hypothetical protein|nr:hypothetical protein [Prevotella sp.]
MNSLARLIVAVAIMLCGTTIANAQSTVYVFMRSAINADCVMAINGGEPFEIRGPLKKTMMNLSGPEPNRFYHPAKKKIVLKEEGKALFSAKYTFYANMDRSNPRDMVAEIQLNLSEGSVHYVKLSFKGMNDVQLKEVEEKEGLKLLKDKKYKELPEFIEQ